MKGSLGIKSRLEPAWLRCRRASAAIQRRGATIRREGGTLGGGSGKRVEPMVSRWRRWSQERVGGVPAAGEVRRVVGEGDKCVKKKMGGSRRMQRPIQSQARKMRMTTTLWTASRSVLYSSCDAGRGATPKRCVVTRIGRSHWALTTTRPDRHGWKRPYFTSDKTCPSCGIVSL